MHNRRKKVKTILPEIVLGTVPGRVAGSSMNFEIDAGTALDSPRSDN
jgi:hypothetical protein